MHANLTLVNSETESRGVLVLNIGSTGVKAARYALSSTREAGRPTLLETGRTTVESSTDATSTPTDVDELLAKVARDFADLAGTVDIVAHRIVHGGDRDGPVELTQETLAALADFNPWAPLHQPNALALVDAAIRRYPRARQVGFFDSAWHRTMPQKHRVLAIPYSLHAHGIKRYGFHGIAFQSVMRQLGAIAPQLAGRRIVLAHLGGGSSLCAVLHGKSVNTTMGMTPLGGIPMATRSGSLDPGVLLHLQRGLAMSADEIDRLLWHESGLKGISAESGDMRKLLASSSDGAQLAIDVYVTNVAQGIASMAACMGGLDALVFSGGIGTHAPGIRERVTNQLRWLGLEVDGALNQAGSPDLTSTGSAVSTYAFPVDEEKEMAIGIALACGDSADTAL